MRKIQVLFFLLMLTAASFGQSGKSPKSTIAKPTASRSGSENLVFTRVELESGPTDLAAWQNHLINGLKKANASLPDSIPAGTYNVEVRFYVDVHGYLTEVKATIDPGYGMGKKAADIIRSYEGSWRPANQCGRPVNSYKKQQFRFVVE